ncbi:MAG: response regulator transcription factor [Deltaproteobacteria bacterium]|uniref:Response regulator transcription factor n=1 Tax=Candidatus Zymogenus saltonus TaxID=2844893 RepID=A0A9D8KF90_9DELT|nr:response regulator transcription factor [Candidatus Zymogenus saltonus]
MRILIVEDEAKVASFIKRGLEEEHYAVDVAEDGKEAVALVDSYDYDLAILDIMLPEMDGLSVLSHIRSVGKAMPVVLLTAKDLVEDKVKGLDMGADDYITKPFAFEELLARIRVLLRRGKPEESLKLSIADLVLDPVTHKVTRDNKEINLTAKEYGLLEYLLRNQRRVLTRTMISEHVWDIKHDTFTNVIDVYINYLRNKIDKGFSKKLLHTIRGVGYKLEA